MLFNVFINKIKNSCFPIYFSFNRKPNKGIVFLQTQGMIGTSPSEVADFLMTESRLHPAEVGDYLGENEK